MCIDEVIGSELIESWTCVGAMAEHNEVLENRLVAMEISLVFSVA